MPSGGTEATIEARGLTKRYGDTLAVDDLSFAVRPGVVTGFLGPNGSGKSTTMRVILGLDAPDAGYALVGGLPYTALHRPLTQVGALLDVGTLAAEGRAVLVSSHLMSELQEAASHLVIVGRGKVIADTSVAALLASVSGDPVELRTAASAEAMTVLARAGAEVAVTARDVLTIKGLSPERTVAALTANHVSFTEVTAHRATLEEAYMELTGDAVEYRAEPGREARA